MIIDVGSTKTPGKGRDIHPRALIAETANNTAAITSRVRATMRATLKRCWDGLIAD
jgi:hypothetical protein